MRLDHLMPDQSTCHHNSTTINTSILVNRHRHCNNITLFPALAKHCRVLPRLKVLHNHKAVATNAVVMDHLPRQEEEERVPTTAVVVRKIMIHPPC